MIAPAAVNELGASSVRAERSARMSWASVPPVAIGLIFAPKRFGARIAAGRWTRVLAVHAGGLLLGSALLLLAAYGKMPGGLSWLWGLSTGEWLRLPAALVVSALCAASEGAVRTLALCGALAGVHGLVWLSALLVMPYVAPAEPGGRLYLRTVKLCLWATVCLVPLGLVVTLVVWVGTTLEARFPSFAQISWESAIAPCVGLWMFWTLSVVLRLGAGSSAALSEQAPLADELRCTHCGYILTGLPTSGRCPECGTEVARSLPPHRAAPQWASALRRRERPAAWLRTTWAILSTGDYFTRVAVRKGRSFAVGFLGRVLFCGGVLIAAGFGVFPWEDARSSTGPEWLFHSAVFLVTVALLAALFMFVGFSLVMLRAGRGGSCGLRSMAVAVCYASALFLPACALLAACLWSASLFLSGPWIRGPLSSSEWWSHFWWWVIHVANTLPAITAFIWAMFRLKRALNDVRYASA